MIDWNLDWRWNISVHSPCTDLSIYNELRICSVVNTFLRFRTRTVTINDLLTLIPRSDSRKHFKSLPSGSPYYTDIFPRNILQYGSSKCNVRHAHPNLARARRIHRQMQLHVDASISTLESHLHLHMGKDAGNPCEGKLRPGLSTSHHTKSCISWTSCHLWTGEPTFVQEYHHVCAVTRSWQGICGAFTCFQGSQDQSSNLRGVQRHRIWVGTTDILGRSRVKKMFEQPAIPKSGKQNRGRNLQEWY